MLIAAIIVTSPANNIDHAVLGVQAMGAPTSEPETHQLFLLDGVRDKSKRRVPAARGGGVGEAIEGRRLEVGRHYKENGSETLSEPERRIVPLATVPPATHLVHA